MGYRSFLFKKVRPGNYLRELSVVVLGVFITLTASTQLTTCSKKKEYRQIISMVYSELLTNKQAIDNCIREMELERRMERYFYTERDNLGRIPDDTLIEYQYIHHAFDFPIFTDHSLEVLKYSAAIHSTKDIAVVRDIMEAYNCVSLCGNFITMYYDTKEEFVNRLSAEAGIRHGSITERLRAEYGSIAMYDYISVSFSDDLIRECRAGSDRVGDIISSLEKRYRIRDLPK